MLAGPSYRCGKQRCFLCEKLNHSRPIAELSMSMVMMNESLCIDADIESLSVHNVERVCFLIDCLSDRCICRLPFVDKEVGI